MPRMPPAPICTTDPSNAAAGHLDLLTAVTHEMGHVLGLEDSTRQAMPTT